MLNIIPPTNYGYYNYFATLLLPPLPFSVGSGASGERGGVWIRGLVAADYFRTLEMTDGRARRQRACGTGTMSVATWNIRDGRNAGLVSAARSLGEDGG